MVPIPRLRPRLATPSRFLAALALASLMQGAAAWAGPFNLTVNVGPGPLGPLPLPSGEPGAIVLDVSFDLGGRGDGWYLDSVGLIDPRDAAGHVIPLRDGYDNLMDFQYRDYPGGRGYLAGVYWIRPETPRGRFTGGTVAVTGKRFDDEGEMIYVTETVTFGFVVPGAAPVTAPEPAAAIPAAIAALGGAGLAAVRRLRAR